MEPIKFAAVVADRPRPGGLCLRVIGRPGSHLEIGEDGQTGQRLNGLAQEGVQA